MGDSEVDGKATGVTVSIPLASDFLLSAEKRRKNGHDLSKRQHFQPMPHRKQPQPHPQRISEVVQPHQ